MTETHSTLSPDLGATLSRAGRWRNRLANAFLHQETTLLIVIAVIAVLTASRNPTFLNPSNLTEILRASVMYFVMACGATLVMVGGGIDFAVGAVFTLGGLTTAMLLIRGVWWPGAVLVGMAIGGVAGYVGHVVITYLHVPPIIATLGTFFVILGIDTVITNGADIYPLPADFQALGQGSVFGVPNIILYAVITGGIFWFLLERTTFGVNVRALGGNRQASIGNGLRVVQLDLRLYVIAGVTAALAGIIYAARVGAGQVLAGGAATTLVVITAVLIGGVSMYGGLGSITGVAVGTVLLSTIANALILANVPPTYNDIVTGSILIFAVAIDYFRRQRLYKPR